MKDNICFPGREFLKNWTSLICFIRLAGKKNTKTNYQQNNRIKPSVMFRF